ncbi:hypothetical protein, partial [uncultured Marinobacter sp.]|uniref:hypothetical protein n=1 Tax=uncultured Marinobacter sp. TaxID=187379 RepID=UPI00259923BA
LLLLQRPAELLALAPQGCRADVVIKARRAHSRSQRAETLLFREQAILHQAPSRITSTLSG